MYFSIIILIALAVARKYIKSFSHDNRFQPTSYAQTPLFQASANGYEGAVRHPLSHTCVNPNPADLFHQTPRFLASANGHEGVVGILLSRADVSPNSPDSDG